MAMGDYGTLDRPDRFNAIDASLSRGLVEAVDRAGAEARAAILTGAGKAFCSGADLNTLLDDYESGAGPDLARLLGEVFHPAVDALLESKVPVIGALNGVAAGAGLGLALACDLRIMSDAAYLTSAFTAIGLIPDSGGSWILPRLVGQARALGLAMTGEPLPAEMFGAGTDADLLAALEEIGDGDGGLDLASLGLGYEDQAPDLPELPETPDEEA